MGKEEDFVSFKKFLRKGLEKLAYSAVLGIACISGLSCGINMPGPGGRIGCTPVRTALTAYLGENAAKQQRGIAFTLKGGHIDLAHTRKYAEWSQEYAKISSSNLRENNSEFSFKGTEPAKYHVKIKYPQNWQNIDENRKNEIIENVAAELGPYFSYMPSIMHETLTWFEWRSTLIVPEFSSAFSWEDRFSDTLGCYIGGLALKDKRHNPADAINLLLENEFKRLGIQSEEVCKQAVKNVEGKWYKTGGLGGDMLMRNLDIGEIDNRVSPCIPPIRECIGIKPWECPIPQLKYVKEMGFDIQVEISPSAKREVFQRILGKEKINPETDYPKIMDYIRKDAARKGYIFIQ
jgi:hypothetical protein